MCHGNVVAEYSVTIITGHFLYTQNETEEFQSAGYAFDYAPLTMTGSLIT